MVFGGFSLLGLQGWFAGVFVFGEWFVVCGCL